MYMIIINISFEYYEHTYTHYINNALNKKEIENKN